MSYFATPLYIYLLTNDKKGCELTRFPMPCCLCDQLYTKIYECPVGKCDFTKYIYTAQAAFAANIDS